MSCDHLFIVCERSGVGDAVELNAIRSDKHGRVLVAFSRSDSGKSSFIEDDFVSEVLAPFDGRYVVITEDGVGRTSLINRLSRRITEHDYKRLFSNPWYEIRQISWPLIEFDVVSPGIESLCRHFKIQHYPGAAGDVRCTWMFEAYWEMMRTYRLALFSESAVREVGGKAFRAVRKIFKV